MPQRFAQHGLGQFAAGFFRPRFSLKAILVLFAVLSAWLAYQVHWLGERREALVWIQQHETGAWSSFDPADVAVTNPVTGVTQPDEPRRAPLIVRLSGAQQVFYINLEKAKLSLADAQRLDHLQQLFPEADGVQLHESGWSHRWPPADREAFFRVP